MQKRLEDLNEMYKVAKMQLRGQFGHEPAIMQLAYEIRRVNDTKKRLLLER